MDQRDDDLRTVSDFIASDPRAQTVYLRSTVEDRRAEMADGVAHYVPSDDDIELGWVASFRRHVAPTPVDETFRSILGNPAVEDRPRTKNHPRAITKRVRLALDRLFEPSRQRSGFVALDASRITVSISDQYAGPIKYSVEATATSFSDALAGALEAEKAEIARLLLMRQVARITASWRDQPHSAPGVDKVRDVVRGAVSMAARVEPPQEYEDENDPDLAEYAAGLRREHLGAALDVIRAGMRMARQVGVSEPVGALFDHFDVLTTLEGSAK